MDAAPDAPTMQMVAGAPRGRKSGDGTLQSAARLPITSASPRAPGMPARQMAVEGVTSMVSTLSLTGSPPASRGAAAYQQVVLCEVANEICGIDIARVEEI